MDVIVSTEHRFEQTPDGDVWTHTLDYAFWQRYLSAFDQVYILARAKPVKSPSEQAKQAAGEGVIIKSIPFYQGMSAYIRNIRQIHQMIGTISLAQSAVIMRVPSVGIAPVLITHLKKTGHPYALEVIGNPADSASWGQYRLGPFFQWWFPRQLRTQCANACAAAYVTRHTLQQHYPTAPGVYTTYYSSVGLDDEFRRPDEPRIYDRHTGPYTLITVGWMDQVRKAYDVLIRAIGHCVEKQLNVRLVIIGDGKLRATYEALSASLGLTNHIQFMGRQTKQTINKQLTQADLFVLPSRSEGLPRAIIEAMATGLPCIGTAVDGIPELLPPEDMVSPDDEMALSNKIREIITDPARLNAMSRHSMDIAANYSDHILRQRRTEFFNYVRVTTDDWIKAN